MTHLADGFRKNYGYVLTINSGRKKNTIKYEVDITYLQTTPQQTRIFEIERTSRVYINDMEPDLLFDKLAYEVGSVFYPLKIEVSLDGSFLSVKNQDEIRKRWDTERGKITNYFKGERAERYCQLMDKVIVDDERLNQALKADCLIAAYFSPIYKSYTPELTIEEIHHYLLINKIAPIRFSVKQQVNPYLNGLNGIELWHTGIVADERSKDDLQHKRNFALSKSIDEAAESVKGKYTARYILHNHIKTIRAINAEWTLDTNNKLNINVSLYETNSNQVGAKSKMADNPNFLVMMDKEEPSGLKSFWKTIFGK